MEQEDIPYLKGAFTFHCVEADSNNGVVDIDGVDIGGRGFYGDIFFH